MSFQILVQDLQYTVAPALGSNFDCDNFTFSFNFSLESLTFKFELRKVEMCPTSKFRFVKIWGVSCFYKNSFFGCRNSGSNHKLDSV